MRVWPTRVTVLSVLVLALACALPAHAAVTIGAVATNDVTEPDNCAPNNEFMQNTSGGPSYDAPSAGVITSWSTKLGSSGGTSARLKVYRPGATATTWTVAGVSAVKTFSPGLNTMPTRIPVPAGDRIAIRTGSPNGGPCDYPYPAVLDSSYSLFEFQASPNPAFDPPTGASVTFTDNSTDHQLVNIAAALEPDADADGFGDGTQDACPGVAGATNGCPPPAPPAGGGPAPPGGLATISVGAAGRGTQHVLKQRGIVVTVTPSMASTISATATVGLPGRSAVVRFKPVTRSVAAGAKTALRLGLSKRSLQRIRKALKRHAKLSAKVVLTAKAPGASTATTPTRVRLKP